MHTAHVTHRHTAAKSSSPTVYMCTHEYVCTHSPPVRAGVHTRTHPAGVVMAGSTLHASWGPGVVAGLVFPAVWPVPTLSSTPGSSALPGLASLGCSPTCNVGMKPGCHLLGGWAKARARPEQAWRAGGRGACFLHRTGATTIAHGAQAAQTGEGL
jgi:hypothetical protein